MKREARKESAAPGAQPMLGIPLRYLLKNPRAWAELAAHPVQVWTNAVDVYVAQREQRRPPCIYQWEREWELRLHEQLGAAWPCAARAEFERLWPEVMGELKAKGIRPGPQSFGSWNDGDPAMVRAVWCLTRHLRPENVVETGVAHGVTTRFILEALERNAKGHLWSIDLPPLEKAWRGQVAVAVGGRFPKRWSYLKGSSRLRLPRVLALLGQIDLFLHDSLHSERNVRFEMSRAWARLRPGGALVVDDVDANWGFRKATQAIARQPEKECAMVCEAEPLHPDLRRFNSKGLFGIVLKDPAATRLERNGAAAGSR
jgi:predicted O-methyltransferase YrrM